MNTAPRLDTTHSLLTGRVRLCERDTFVVDTDGGDVIARRAASCLLVPRAGDRVLMGCTPAPYLLAVLERDDQETPSEIAVDGDTRIVARNGSLELDAEEGLRLRTRKVIDALAERITVKTRTAELVSSAVDAVAKHLRLSADEIGVVARHHDLICERISQKAERVYRFIGELDQLRAHTFDYRAEHTAQIRGDNTVMVARELAKIDGEQIHIG